ncbi:Zinc/iron permease [Leucosporidium creatinivorum]|uniref:Zinc/iron permease n=1 Tax=Leucosporidium creatinivorum TaxID=106004 RepID=A0A1Y2F9W4_9BASI|nr:Zinc/iron permease [Leucosporidium creatinivorum]
MSKTLFSSIFFAAKHFGTGIIISTAFVHLLYHSFVMFSNACLGELAFEPAAAAITMGDYTVFGVDFFVMRWLNARSAKRVARNAAANADGPQDSPSPPSSSDGKHAEAFGHSHGPLPEVGMDMASPQAHFDVQILEAGIIFHSIMIGVSLGASGGSQWTPLFCAIVFHQLFEGLALGSRIGTLIFPAGRGLKKWIMGAAFALITPIGVAIGIAVHSGYNPNSGAALLSIGVLDAISAGILIYAGIIEMLYHDFMLGELSTAPKGRVALAFFFLLAGSICMSVLGKWA